MSADGSNQKRLTRNIDIDDSPSWSPDGTKLVFTRYTYNDYEIYTMNSDGRNETRITFSDSNHLEPAWSPDGTRLVFELLNHKWEFLGIYSMDIDGSNVNKLFEYGNNLSWSPDGSEIVYDAWSDIYVINSSGVNRRKLVEDGNDPSWSPDGSKIAFVTHRDGNKEIYVMDVDGSNQRRLTTDPAEDSSPTWSPDSSRIAFVTDRDGNKEIYVMNADGSNQINISNHPGRDDDPAWCLCQEREELTTLRIESNVSDFQVWINDVYYHTTPDNYAVLHNLSPNTYVVTLKKSGCADASETATIAPGITNTVFIPMNCSTGGSDETNTDLDGDGVPNNQDGCYNPECDLVDSRGCPKDSDKDGVSECDDQCPTEAGLPAMNGCPAVDQDNDGVIDNQDGCYNPDCHIVDSRGCPRDSDSDGQNDCEDDCPSEYGDRLHNGCPGPEYAFGRNAGILVGAVVSFSIFIVGMILYKRSKTGRKDTHKSKNEKRKLDEMLSKGLIKQKEYDIAVKEIDEHLKSLLEE